MQLTQPYRIKSELISKLDLGHKIIVTLTFAKALWAGELIKESKAHTALLIIQHDHAICIA